MTIVDLPIDQLVEAPWNPNRMDDGMSYKLKTNVDTFGFVQPLVVRRLENGLYEVLSGNQRLRILREMGVREVPCVVVKLDDARARLLSQALNRIQGEDDLGLRAELFREVLQAIPDSEVLALLPETAESLQALTDMGAESLAEHLQSWDRAQKARLRHLTFQLASEQLEGVEEAIQAALSRLPHGLNGNPNRRGNALHLICKKYLETQSTYTAPYTPEAES